MFGRNIQIIMDNIQVLPQIVRQHPGLFLLATISDIITIIMIVLFFRYVV
jgi:hypothetical protein